MIRQIFRWFIAIFLLIVSILLFFCGYDNWRMQQEFIKSDKVKTEAIVKIDENNVRTFNFTGNSYGVATYDKKLKAGDIVTIYYQKDKPYRVSTSKNQYGEASKDIVRSFAGGIYFLFAVVFNRKKLCERKDHV